MFEAEVIEMTSQLAPVYIGILALLATSGAGIAFCAWKPRVGGISFSTGFEIPSRSLASEAN